MRFFKMRKKRMDLEVITSILLILSTISALLIYNSSLRDIYKFVFNKIFIAEGFTIHMFVNDFLMAIFFLVAGLEIKHEILHGNLSTLKKASFPVVAAIGGVLVPAIIFYIFNQDTPFLNGLCIPISTDIAFALGMFYIFRKKLNPRLKVFLLSLAVVDDLISIICIGVVYSMNLNLMFLLLSLSVLTILFVANKVYKVQSITYYLISGCCLWYFIYLSGIPATISGILLAIFIPSSSRGGISTLDRLLKLLSPLNSLFIVPLFAFANTGISLTFNVDISSAYPLIFGIMAGLCLGKPLGIMAFSYIGCALGLIEKPPGVNFGEIFLVSILAGIGFTMSIFVTEIAFIHNMTLIDIAKMSILISSIISILLTTISIPIYNIFKNLFGIQRIEWYSKYYFK